MAPPAYEHFTITVCNYCIHMYVHTRMHTYTQHIKARIHTESMRTWIDKLSIVGGKMMSKLNASTKEKIF